MPTFTTIPNGLVAVGAKPFASTMQALRDNPLAIQEGDPTAPKIQPNALRRIAVNGGAAAQTQTFTGLGGYGGIEFEVMVRNDGTGNPINFQFSTDGGSTWSTAQSLGGVLATSGAAWVAGSFDFASGQLDAILETFQIAGTAAASLTRTSAALAGASLAIDAIRFQGGISNITCIAIIRPVGASA